MASLNLGANVLTTTWERYDWRESFLAPGLVVLQALTREGKTASGAGDTREQALRRCLGETAELHALAEMANRPQTGGAGPRPFDPMRDGIAASPGAQTARSRAVTEAYERRMILAWWQGQIKALRVPDAWTEAQGLRNWLETVRKGAQLRRQTGLWWLSSDCGMHVMIAQTASLQAQDRILGYGAAACPVQAALKALREALLMELNLIELLALRARPGELSEAPVQKQITAFARNCPTLLPPDDAAPPARTDALVTTDMVPACFDPPPALHDITPVGGPLAVYLCQPERHGPVQAIRNDTPFL